MGRIHVELGPRWASNARPFNLYGFFLSIPTLLAIHQVVEIN